jgi:hypothetical protein
MNGIDLILVTITLALFLRLWTPWGERVSGNLVRRQDLSLFGRLRMHGPAIALLLAAAVAAAVTGPIAGWTVAGIVTLLILLVVLPMRYTLTVEGIQAGGTPFRRWTEFGGVARRLGGVRLQGVAGARPLTVWLSGGRDDDEFVLLLRQLVRGSYKGELGPEAGVPVAGAAPGTVQAVGVGGS